MQYRMLHDMYSYLLRLGLPGNEHPYFLRQLMATVLSHHLLAHMAYRLLRCRWFTVCRPFGVSVVFCAPGYVRTNISNNTAAAQQFFLQPDSPYAPLRENMDTDLFAKVKNCATPEDFARSFVAAVLSKSPPAYHRAGTLALAAPLAAWILPTWLKDHILSNRAGLLTFNPPASDSVAAAEKTE
jgi:hypothetical protein